jgi:hypothetical protein
MPQNPNVEFDLHTLDLIEINPTGSVPATPAFQDSILRLVGSHQIYANADFKGGYATARILAGKPCFFARNIKDAAENKITTDLIESNNSIFDRYLDSLDEKIKINASARREAVVGKVSHHRAKWIDDKKVVGYEPIHSLFLIPGCGKHVGLPGNYLYGMLFETLEGSNSSWAIHIHDTDVGLATCSVGTFQNAFTKLEEIVASAPFAMAELGALDFKLN